MGASHSPTKGRFDVPASSHFLNIYSYFILTSSVGSVFATSRGQEEMGRAQRHREPPWGTPGRSRGTAGWHPGRGGEGGTSEPSAGARTRRAVLAASRRRGRHGSQAQACVRPPVLSSPQEAQQPAGSATFAARTPAARSPRPGCRPAPSRTRRPQKRPPRCHHILALRPSLPPDRRLREGGDWSCCANPGPSGAARHLAGTQTGGTRDRLGGDLNRAQGSEAGIPKPQMFGSSNWK